MTEELHDTISKLNNEKKIHMEAQYENSILKKKLQNAEGLSLIVKKMQEERDGLVRQLADSRNDHQIYLNQAQTARDEMHSRFREFELKEKAFIDQNSVLNKKNFQFEEKTQSQANIINGFLSILILPIIAK